MSTDNGKGSWFMKTLAGINQLAEELELDDMATQKLREFVLNKAKEEYMAGNRSGIRWARENPHHGCTLTHTKRQKATA